MAHITVIIADQDLAGRAICQELLQPEKDIRIVGRASTREEVIALAGKHNPHVVLLGLSLCAEGSFELLTALHLGCPDSVVLLLTDHISDPEKIVEALARGARGYLERAAYPTFLVKAVRAVHAGEAWVPRKMVGQILDRLVRLSAQGG